MTSCGNGDNERPAQPKRVYEPVSLGDAEGWAGGKIDFEQVLAAMVRGASGVKLGPGVLRTIIPIVSVGIVALAGVAYALASNPPIALAAFALGLLFLAFVVYRSFDYAEKNPIPAIFGGAEILQLIRDQASARDKSLVEPTEPPVIGSSASAAIEHRVDGDA